MCKIFKMHIYRLQRCLKLQITMKICVNWRDGEAMVPAQLRDCDGQLISFEYFLFSPSFTFYSLIPLTEIVIHCPLYTL